MSLPRVALFTDCYGEANGVATFSRQLAAFACRRQIPFLCAHSGSRTRAARHSTFTEVELKRGPAAFSLDHNLSCDPFLWRHKSWVTAQVRAFRPDLVHIAAPGDVGILGLWVAHTLGVPLVASWHTNLHAYAGRRLNKLFSFLPDDWRRPVCSAAEDRTLRACMAFYCLARFLLAPNQEMVRLLEERTGKPAFLLAHGVDPEAFSPLRRTRRDDSFVIGYAGRLTPEKNLRLFGALERNLLARGEANFRFCFAGEGDERDWLRKNLCFAEMPGVLHGAALAETFANMDAFVFPSQTDTFGLVLLEAMASGVPVVVSPETGARVGVEHGVTGFLAPDLDSFAETIGLLMGNAPLRRRAGAAARAFACANSWVSAFERLYATYECGLEGAGEPPMAASAWMRGGRA